MNIESIVPEFPLNFFSHFPAARSTYMMGDGRKVLYVPADIFPADLLIKRLFDFQFPDGIAIIEPCNMNGLGRQKTMQRKNQ